MKNPLKFRESLLNSIPTTRVDESYKGVINVLIYFVWRGAFTTTGEIIQARAHPDLGLICLSCYKAFLPIIQLTRLGYPGDVLVLMRALMERIAILDYLHAYPDLVQNYKNGKGNLNKQAMPWAKNHAPQNWMHLYSYMTSVAHSKREGVASHIFDENEIGEAFLYMLPHSKINQGMTEELLSLICYAIGALDPIAGKVLNLDNFQIFPLDSSLNKYIDSKDQKYFQNFLMRFVAKYSTR